MPYSSTNGKALIKRIMARINPDRALDIGCGAGTYAKMFPAINWTGVEVWEPYVEQFELRSIYDRLIVADARAWEPDGRWPVAMLGDVLEHMTAGEAAALVTKLRQHCDYVITSIPIGYYPQDEYAGNPFERHIVDNWTDAAVIETFGQPLTKTIEGDIGVYVYGDKPLPLKIAVYTIAKNEEQFVERFCASAKDADLILIADTGSTDDTVAKARECGAVVHDICISPWRFDKARDAALALLPRDIDVCISLDLDEVMEPGWREEIERVWTEGITRLRYKFDWGCGISFYYEKIHARHGYHWHHPCHEYPRPDGRIKEVYAQTDALLVSHHPDPTKSRGQYLDLLKLSVDEDPHCPRNAFYYARELTFYRQWIDAIVALRRYLDMPQATWQNERCYAMRLLGQSYSELGDINTSRHWYERAAAEAPNTREPWVELAALAYRTADWQVCYDSAMRALAITDKALVYTMDPSVWGAKPHDYAAIAAFNLGMYKEAVEQGELAHAADPDDHRLTSNLLSYRMKLEA